MRKLVEMPDSCYGLVSLREAHKDGGKIREEELAFVSIEGLRELVALEMKRLRGLKAGALERAIFDSVAAQSSKLLTPYLEEILTLSLRIERGSRTSTWWNGGASPNVLAALRHRTFDDSNPAKARVVSVDRFPGP